MDTLKVIQHLSKTLFEAFDSALFVLLVSVYKLCRHTSDSSSQWSFEITSALVSMLGHCTTLGGMFNITMETPSVINHNKTICSAENQQNDTTRGDHRDQKTIFYQMYLCCECGHGVLSFSITAKRYLLCQCNLWLRMQLIPLYCSTNTMLLSVILPACITHAPKDGWPRELEGDAWTAPGGEFDKVNLLCMSQILNLL